MRAWWTVDIPASWRASLPLLSVGCGAGGLWFWVRVSLIHRRLFYGTNLIHVRLRVSHGLFERLIQGGTKPV